jgi:hypothetical protein
MRNVIKEYVESRKSKKSGQLSLLLSFLALFRITTFSFSTLLVVLDIFIINSKSLINLIAKSGLILNARDGLVLVDQV